MLTAEDKMQQMAKELHIKNEKLLELQKQLYIEQRTHQNLLMDYEHVLGVLANTKNKLQTEVFALA